MSFQKLVKELEQAIQTTYSEGVSLEDAERLAAKCLHAQLLISNEIKSADLDARTRKSGVKAIRAAIYLEIVQKADKKPTEAQITSTIDTDSIVNGEQLALDKAEVDRDALERYYDIFQNTHIYFRGIAKGRFDG